MLLHRSDFNISENFRQKLKLPFQILQENIRWKALDEIYKIYMLLHRADTNISEKCLTEPWCEKFEWFDPSPIEPFNLARRRVNEAERPVRAVGRDGEHLRKEVLRLDSGGHPGARSSQGGTHQ